MSVLSRKQREQWNICTVQEAEGAVAKELVERVLATNVYQFLEKLEEKGYLSVCVNKSLRIKQDGGSLVYTQHKLSYS